MNAINKEPERHEIEALLPWHAAGTLNRRDADRVEQAIAGDRELARRYDLVREELAETIHLNETLGAPAARAMEKLLAAIDAEQARAPRRQRSFDLGGRNRRAGACGTRLVLEQGAGIRGRMRCRAIRAERTVRCAKSATRPFSRLNGSPSSSNSLKLLLFSCDILERRRAGAPKNRFGSSKIDLNLSASCGD